MSFELINFLKVKNSAQELNKIKIERSTKPIKPYFLEEGTADTYREESIIKIEKDGQFIDYFGSEDFFNKNNIKNEHLNYVISECNDKDKYSKGYYDCTGIIVVGEIKDDARQISFISHQESGELKKKFIEDLIKSLKEIREN